MIVTLALVATSAYFGPSQFWTIVGVALTAIGLLGAYIIRLKNARQDKKEDSLSLYVHFVDDLQVELKRLHDLLIEERHDNAAEQREKDVLIEKLEMKVLSLQKMIEELEAHEH